VGLHSQERAGEIELVPADGTLDLQLPEDDPLIDGENLGRFPMLGFPNKLLVIAAAGAGKRLVRGVHDHLGIGEEHGFHKHRQNLGQNEGKGRQDGD